MSTIGERIYEIRRVLNITQTDFSDRIGITQTSLSQLEAGKNNPSFDVLVAISQVFKISYNWLIDGIGQMKKIDKSAIEVLEAQLSILKLELKQKDYTIELQEQLIKQLNKGNSDN